MLFYLPVCISIDQNQNGTDLARIQIDRRGDRSCEILANHLQNVNWGVVFWRRNNPSN